MTSPATKSDQELGNDEFGKGNYNEAISHYNRAINKCPKSRVPCLTNRSLCFLRLGDNDKALNDAMEALRLDPFYIKAIYRKACALEKLGRLSEAYVETKELMVRNPGDKSFQSLYTRLSTDLKQQIDEQSSTKAQIDAAAKAIVDASDRDGVYNHLRKLVHFVQRGSGARQLGEPYIDTVHHGEVEVMNFVVHYPDSECQCLAFKFFEEICKESVKRSKFVLTQVIECDNLVRIIAHSEKKEVSASASALLDTAIYWISDLEARRKEKKPINVPYKFDESAQKLIDEVFRNSGYWLDEPSCLSHGRDNFLRFVIKYADREQSLAWSARYISFGIPKVLRIAGSIASYPRYLPMSPDTTMLATCTLGSIYDDLCSDPERELFRQTCESFINDLLVNCNEDNAYAFKVKAIQCLICILQGVFDVGNSILGSHSLVPVIMELASSGNATEQKIALDALLLSSSKADKAAGLLSSGLEVLKVLFKSTNEDVQVRALVEEVEIIPKVTSTNNKVVSCKGTDYSKRTISETGFQRLTKACIDFLCSSIYDRKRHAIDGLAYLTLDADVKEELLGNEIAMKELFSVCQEAEKAEHGSQETAFSATVIISNLSNAEPLKRPDEEMVKLAKYAQHHIPVSHPKDSEEYIKKRRSRLVHLGVCSILNFLAKQKSESCCLTVAKIFCALSEEQSHRGEIVAAGAAKTLVPLSSKTRSSSSFASRAISKLAISCNPEMAFPGERCVEVVDSVCGLLHPDNSGLDNFEALLALTNLATVSSLVRSKMLKEHYSDIEHYMFEEHEMIRRAATEVVCNLACEHECRLKYEGENDRVKLLVALCGEDDLLLNKAAAGALCQLTDQSLIICRKVLEVKTFNGIFKELMTSDDAELQFRAFYVVQNIMNKDDSMDLLKCIVASELMDVIMAMTRIELSNDDVNRKRVVDIANEIVKFCLQQEFIKPGVDAFN
ncbi:hypothetical protein ACOME3_000735 [Neoechinorhynchus agilis]